MSIEERYFERARSNGELDKLFGGYPEYSIESPLADLPTDFSASFMMVRKLVGEDIQLRTEVLDALKKLATDSEFGWMVLYYLGQVSLFKKYHGLDLIDDDLVSSIASSLRFNKPLFAGVKKWEGTNYPDGLWGVVRSVNKKLHVKDGITVLPEEL